MQKYIFINQQATLSLNQHNYISLVEYNQEAFTEALYYGLHRAGYWAEQVHWEQGVPRTYTGWLIMLV